MEVTEMIRKYVVAGFPILGIQTYEPDVLFSQILRDLSDLPKHPDTDDHIDIYTWDCVQGLACINRTANNKVGACIDIRQLLETIPKVEFGSVFILHNFHKYLKNAEVIQRLQNFVPLLKALGVNHTLVITGPTIELPP